jgi:hypothetical protein
MVALAAFQAGDVYIDYPYEDAKFRFEKKTGKVFARFNGQPENEIDRSSSLYREAISAGTEITKDEYFND